jgi:hypothetical protein
MNDGAKKIQWEVGQEKKHQSKETVEITSEN